MDTATLVIAHHVLSLGSIRETARALKRPPATVSGALSRLQTHLSVPLTTKAGSRLIPTLEGRRINHHLKIIADLVEQLAKFSTGQAMALPSLSLLALSRFVVVGGSGSIRAAANDLGMGQPQLTRQINTLESQIGVGLLQRSASGVVLTEQGIEVLRVSRQICELWLRISEQSDERFRQTGRRIRLGAITPLGWESRIAVDLARLAADWPNLLPRTALYLSSNSADELLAGLDRRQHDLVLLDTDEIPAPLSHRILSRSPLVLVGPPRIFPSNNGDLATLLTANRLVLPSVKSGLRQKFIMLADEILSADERARLTIMEIDSIPIIANMVIDHGYLSLLPRSAVVGMEGRMRTIQLPPRYEMPLALAWKKEATIDVATRIIGDALQGEVSSAG